MPAKVYLDGEYVGTTPYILRDTKVVGSVTRIRLAAPGYAETNGLIRRNGELNVGALIAGIFFLIPLLWLFDYKGQHFFELEVPGGSQAGEAVMPGRAVEPAP